MTVLLGLVFSGTFRNIRRGEEGEGGRKAAATRLPSCRLAVSSALLVVRPIPPSPKLSNSLQFINETKTCRLFRICFVLVLRFALCCGFAFFLLLVFFLCFPILGGRIFNDLVG